MVSFGDTVRIRVAPETEALALANLTGQVYGETTPSVTRVDVIGVLKSDYAVSVYVEEHKTQLWFAEQLLEFVDHGAGTVISLDGIDKRWTRAADGEWIEETVPGRPRKAPWWKFW